MGGAAFEIDIDAVRLVADGNDFGAQFPERCGSHLVGSAIGTVDGNPEPAQRHITRQGTFDEFDIAVDIAIHALGASDLARLGELGIEILVEKIFDFQLKLVGKLVSVGSEKLDSIIGKWVVRRRDHYADIGPQRAGQHGNSGVGMGPSRKTSRPAAVKPATSAFSSM